MWRGIKPGDEMALSAFSGPVIFRGMLFGLASWALFNMYRDDERYKELTDDDKLMYHHFWIGDGKEDHYRMPKAFEVGAIFATVPEIITQSLDDSEDMKWTREMLGKALTSSFGLDIIPQLIKPAIEVGTNRDRFRDQPILPMRLQSLKPEAQYDPYTSETIKELVQLIPEGAPDWMRSPKKLEHLLKGYFGGLARYTLLAADAMTREATGAGEKPASTRQDNPLLASFVGDKVPGRTRYTDELHSMTVDITEIANTIKRYEDSGEKDRARALKQSAADKLRHKAALSRINRQVSKLRQQVREVMENKQMNSDTKRQRVNDLNRKISQTSGVAVKRYRQAFR